MDLGENMKRSAIQIFLVITICSFIFASCASPLRYAGSSRVPPLSTDLNFEKSDQDDQLKNHQRGSDASLSKVFLIAFFSGTNHFKTIPCFYSHPFPLNEVTFFLRC